MRVRFDNRCSTTPDGRLGILSAPCKRPRDRVSLRSFDHQFAVTLPLVAAAKLAGILMHMSSQFAREAELQELASCVEVVAAGGAAPEFLMLDDAGNDADRVRQLLNRRFRKDGDADTVGNYDAKSRILTGKLIGGLSGRTYLTGLAIKLIAARPSPEATAVAFIELAAYANTSVAGQPARSMSMTPGMAARSALDIADLVSSHFAHESSEEMLASLRHIAQTRQFPKVGLEN